MGERNIIVAGVSCAGKSTFIAGDLAVELASEGYNHERDIDLLFAGKLVKSYALKSDAPQPISLGDRPVSVLHYNLLMPFEAAPDEADLRLEEEPLLNALCALGQRYRLYLCYAPDAVIRARMAVREEVEPSLDPSTQTYPNARFAACFQRTDQRQLVLAFGRKLASFCDDIKIVYSNSCTTSLLEWHAFCDAPQTTALEAALTDHALSVA